ncbi:flagellar basal body L-ring protein FlgH [Roseateles sp. DB2]|uniref:flagellar basal body L-ring protein FlgH n=1 Tax=Roseateles sp. DB2 TaxID=3453717 RepID=UPI003EEC7B4F
MKTVLLAALLAAPAFLRAAPDAASPVQAPASAVAVEASPVPRPRAKGSLYSDAQFQSLTADRRRFEVGDALTILVIENATASSSANTGTQRDAQLGVALSTPSRDRHLSGNTSNEFNGTGRTQRAGRLLAQITVLVREVLPNGDLRVAGDQLLEINGERQTIHAEGRVRPRDVNEQNTVQSHRLAEARLSFAGDGVLGELQKPRWWQRLLGLFGI